MAASSSVAGVATSEGLAEELLTPTEDPAAPAVLPAAETLTMIDTGAASLVTRLVEELGELVTELRASVAADAVGVDPEVGVNLNESRGTVVCTGCSARVPGSAAARFAASTPMPFDASLAWPAGWYCIGCSKLLGEVRKQRVEARVQERIVEASQTRLKTATDEGNKAAFFLAARGKGSFSPGFSDSEDEETASAPRQSEASAAAPWRAAAAHWPQRSELVQRSRSQS